MFRSFLLSLLLVFGMAGMVSAQDIVGALPKVIDARMTSTSERARLILDLSATTSFAVASIDNPMQIAVDVQAADVVLDNLVSPSGEGIVSNISVEKAGAGRVRAWLTLAQPARVQQAYFLEAFDDQPARLVVDLVPTTEAEFTQLAALDLEAVNKRQPLLGNAASGLLANGGPVLSSRPLIIIDPGHGGQDSGAEAASGVHEKDIVLAFSRILQKLLVDTKRFDVALTREDDRFLTLEERVAVARDNHADLFISVHADYFEQEDVRGASIYTRGVKATGAMDALLADRQNRVDLVAGFATPAADDQVVSILVDLMKREMRRQSYRAAQAIVQQLEPSVRLRKFPVRTADFLVLQAPDVPSVLVELGFLSNVEDITNLTTEAWRDRVAQALARGVASYFSGIAQK